MTFEPVEIRLVLESFLYQVLPTENIEEKA